MSSEVVALEESERAQRAVIDALRRGGLAVVPSDTVPALIADAFQPMATRRLLAAKGRGRTAPLTVLVWSPYQAGGLVADLPSTAERLMTRFWPGPLTVVLQAPPDVGWDLGETAGTVALRIPDHAFLTAVIRELGPLASSGAQQAEEPAPASVAEARAQLGDAVAVYVDGPCGGPPVSTVVDLTRGDPVVLRAGALSAEAIQEAACAS